VTTEVVTQRDFSTANRPLLSEAKLRAALNRRTVYQIALECSRGRAFQQNAISIFDFDQQIRRVVVIDISQK
jgi:hypothetical protein